MYDLVIVDHEGNVTPVLEHLEEFDLYRPLAASELVACVRDELRRLHEAQAAGKEEPVTTDHLSQLVELAETLGLVSEDLDEVAHDLASETAADINNGGLEGQIQYLIEQVDADYACVWLQERATEKAAARAAGETSE